MDSSQMQQFFDLINRERDHWVQVIYCVSNPDRSEVKTNLVDESALQHIDEFMMAHANTPVIRIVAADANIRIVQVGQKLSDSSWVVVASCDPMDMAMALGKVFALIRHGYIKLQ